MSRIDRQPKQVSDRRFVYLLSVAHRRLQRWSEAQAGSVTAAQAGVLFSLKPGAGSLIGDVAKLLGVGAAGISGLVDRMEAAGLVRRAPDPTDGRAVRLVMTETGQAARDVAKARAAATNARLIEGFSEQELAVVARWLKHVDERFRKDDDA